MIQSAGMCPASIMLVGECPNAEEAKAGIPFAGYSLNAFNKLLTSAGISLNATFRTHVIRDRPFGGDPLVFIAQKKKEITPQHKLLNGKYVLEPLPAHIEMLKRDIEMCQPNVIIAFGNLALWALTGEWGVTSWRSSTLICNLDLSLNYKPKVIPTFSPQMVNRVHSWTPILTHDLRKAKKESAFKEVNDARYNFVLGASYSTTLQILSQLKNQLTEPRRLAVDIETKIWNIECIALAWSIEDAICIPFIDSKQLNSLWTLEEETTIVFALYEILTHPNCEVIGQNFSYDFQYILRRWLFRTNLKRDTMIAQHSMFNSMQKDLSFLSSLYRENHVHWKEDGKGFIPNEQRWTYNCRDACITFEIDLKQREAVSAMGLSEVEDFQQSLFPIVMDTMQRGIRVNHQLRADFDTRILNLINEREQYLKDILGYLPNIKSPPQMQKLFYTELGQKVRLAKKTGNPTCDDEALRKLSAKEPLLKPLTTAISELRSLGVFLSTFVRCTLGDDQRLHSEFKITGTETYRFASSANAFDEGTNFQNIPDGKRSTIELPNVRELFIPDEGYTFFDVDLDSADLRIVAQEANLEEMVAMLAEGKKVYVEVMKEYYKDPALTKHAKEYTMFKSLCHGTHYLGTPKGLAERLGLLVHEVEVIQKWYYGKFPGLEKWQSSIKNQVFTKKMVSNVFGYRSYFFDRIEGTIFNQAIAWIPQSTVGIIINRAYKDLATNHKEIQVLLQVHDSLAGQFPTSRKEEFTAIVKKAAEVELPYEKRMTIPAEVHTSEVSWGHCK